MRSGRKGFGSELVSNDPKWSRKGPDVEVEGSILLLRGSIYGSREYRVRFTEGRRNKERR